MPETLYRGQWRLSPLQSGTLGPHTVLPPITISCPVVFSWISLMVWNLFPFKGYCGKRFLGKPFPKGFLGKARITGRQIWAVRGLSHLDDLMFHQKHCMRCDTWVSVLSWWSCQSPVAHSCSLLNHPNSFCRGMFKLNTKFDAYSLLYSLSHFECNVHTVHMLTQWHLPPPLTSTVRLSLFTHAHSSPLSLASRLHGCCANHSCYISNGWTFSGQTSYSRLFISNLSYFLNLQLEVIFSSLY